VRRLLLSVEVKGSVLRAQEGLEVRGSIDMKKRGLVCVRWRSMAPRRKPNRYGIAGLKNMEFIDTRKGDTLEMTWNSNLAGIGKISRRRLLKGQWK
tara:strand:+ start:1215 stop:1502 length:288 start_codon:yes stop_codon:yes gene_type:complete